MSRIGKQPVKIPSGVNVEITDKQITVNGSMGSLSQQLIDGISIKQEGDEVLVSRDNDERISKSNHGLIRSLVDNMVKGVSKGFEKKLEINGVGFRANVAGSDLKMNLGFSHEVVYKIPQGVKVSVEQNVITVSGIDKQQVGQISAEIRSLKKPEPYKGKGIKYVEERIIRKSGKSGKEKA